MPKTELLQRLAAADPGWPEWAELIAMVRSLPFSWIRDEYLGDFIVSGRRLCFAVRKSDFVWPSDLPPYVSALAGMNADEYEMAGGYARAFTGEPTMPGHAFVGPVPDSLLGHPEISIPPGCRPFQTNAGGALFHLGEAFSVLYPSAEQRRLCVLDRLDVFTRTCIRAAIHGHPWFDAYAGRGLDLFD